jgi:ribosomal protein L30E
MFDYKHPLGNFKISIVKFFAKAFSNISLFFLSFLFKIDKNKNEIIISSAFHAPWKADKDFYHFYHEIKDCTLLDSKRLYTLWFFSKSLNNLKSNILDIGCLKGGAGYTMAKANRKGTTYLIDTFEGLIENENYHKKNHFVFKDISFVKNKIKSLKLKKAVVIKTNFPKNIGKSFKKKKFKLCHLDVNTYNATKLSFEFIRKKIVKNGVIIFDDYGIHSTEGIKKYVDTVMKRYRNEFSFINNYMGQCILIKK